MIDKLEFFIALAKAQHFGRAAEELRHHPADAVGRDQAA